MTSKKVKDILHMAKKVPINPTSLKYGLVSFNCLGIACVECPILKECDKYEGSIKLNKQEVNIIVKNCPELFI